MIAMVGEWALAGLLVLGGLFGLVGSWGLLRLPDPLQRLHAPTKATTIGVGAALVAAGAQSVILNGAPSWPEVLVAVFLFVTAPLSAMWLARVHLWQRIPRDSLPAPKTGTWATFQDEDRRTDAPPPGR